MMIEIDHSLLNRAEQPPEPARPILASHLLELEEKQRKIFSEEAKCDRVKTGCGEIDELLGGGFERGILVGISADGTEGKLISLHLLASILIAHLKLPASKSPRNPTARSKAIVIDTTGSFPLPLLAKVLKSRIIATQALSARAANQKANYQLASQSGGVHVSNVDDDVQQCLEMIAISRVFDIEGLWEVLGEIGHDASHDPPNEAVMSNKGALNSEVENQSSPPWPEEIVDSEEETTLSNAEAEATSIAKPTRGKDEVQATEIIIIDNLTHIINELFTRKEKGEAHALLGLLSQTLHTLSQSQNILTILHNTVTSTKPPYNAPTPMNPSAAPSKQPASTRAIPKSLFPSNTSKPSLGQIFAQFPSLHLFLSALPKTRDDADRLYSQAEDAAPDTVGYCTVVEVLKDETPILGDDREKGRHFGWREQKWTALEVAADGVGLVGAFQTKGNMRGMGLEREKGRGLMDGGRMARIHGFGGRRV